MEHKANPGYVAGQIAKAFTTAEQHPDAETRDRAQKRIGQWRSVLANLLTGYADYGSRAPLPGVPIWATPEVVTGGFVTGALLAAGPMLPHEHGLLQSMPPVTPGNERILLNAYFVSEAGFHHLAAMLESGCFHIEVPEEAALLTAVWLARNGHAEAARELLDEIAPQFPRLRFYPAPAASPDREGSRVHLITAGQAASSLAKMPARLQVQAQKESVNVWAPFYDRIVAMFLETVADGWPCRHYPVGWSSRAKELIEEYVRLRRDHTICRKMERPNQHYAQLLDYLRKATLAPASLTGREVGRIRKILSTYQAKRGAPGSPQCAAFRERQARDVAAPAYREVAQAVLPRLAVLPKDDGVDDVDPLLHAVTEAEAAASPMVPAGTPLPDPVRRRVERCLAETIDVLVERGLITSADTMAALLPQVTSGLRSASFADPRLKRLYAATYRAFRRRRSLLLLNLEKQVQIEELPWVRAMEPFRTERLNEAEQARRAIEEIVALALVSFPHAILPNKLLQELTALARSAKLDLPLVEEVAADIFMGRFSNKFIDVAARAGTMLRSSLYARYYAIDYDEVSSLAARKPVVAYLEDNGFGKYCAARAGVELNRHKTAENGMVIEQEQIVTTHNLAVLFDALNLKDALGPQLPGMARACFLWICRRLQMHSKDRHTRLIQEKNSAYAWRQMTFFLSVTDSRELREFLHWAEEHLDGQDEPFRTGFRSTLNGLARAASGSVLKESFDAVRFLGWSTGSD